MFMSLNIFLNNVLNYDPDNINLTTILITQYDPDSYSVDLHTILTYRDLN